MNTAHPFRRHLEIALVHIGRLAVAPLPRRAVLLLARVLGGLGYATLGRLKPVALANLDLALGPDVSADEKRRILRAACRNFALVALDLFWFSRRTRRRIDRWVRFGFDPASYFAKERGPLICVTGHFGNWEVLGMAMSHAGYPLSSVATPLKNPAVDDMLIAMRETTGQTVIHRDGALKRLLSILRDGGRIALLLDQNVQLHEGGVFMDFFGLPATMSPAGGLLACHTGADVAIGFCLPEPDGRYVVRVEPRMAPPPVRRGHTHEATEALNRSILDVYERIIREHPAYWLWMYKRWKHIRPGDDPGRYLFYSSPTPEPKSADPSG